MITITAVYDELRPSINLVTADIGGAIAARAAAEQALDRQTAAEAAANSASGSATEAFGYKEQTAQLAAEVTQDRIIAQQQAAIATQASENTQVAIVEVATNLVAVQAIVATLVNK